MATTLPIAVIGAGPVGLAAAAHLVAAGETPLVLEAGSAIGASMRRWGHVKVFSPWRYNIDAVARALLLDAGWQAPDPEAYPTGGEIVARYLGPLAALPPIAPHIRLDARVVEVTRLGFDKMKTDGRDEAPFALTVRDDDGREEQLLARAVIDASGTHASPNPLGAGGLPAIGERALAEHIYYGIPDVLDRERVRYVGKRVLVVGSGHSAFNALIDLVRLAGEEPGTRITWAVRGQASARLFGGGANDQLPERGSLGKRVRQQVARGAVELVSGFKIARLEVTNEGIVASSAGDSLPPVDEIIATTGFRPDLSMLSELRLALDPAVECPAALAPLVDPNVHSCGTVRPHGALELKHPETDFFIVGMKSYGRAPTFLLLTGYEQVRSVVAALSGDWAAARDVRLVLPETGVCSTSFTAPTAVREPTLAAAGGCCGG